MRARVAGIAVLLAASACRSSHGTSAPREGPATSAAASAPVALTVLPYPRGRWRLAPPDTLSNVVLWVSHILVRYNHSDRDSLLPLRWQAEPPAPARSRAEALAIATRISTQAGADPASFARFAAEQSEDIVTSATGGSLGGVRASDLLLADSQVLDALASLHDGEVSRPVETQHGFHVFLRRAPPPLTSLAARRIVVAYDGAPGMGASPAAPANRTRPEAAAIARSIAQALRADSSRFAQYIAEYPARADADPTGAIGVWTSEEPGDFAREREQLARLTIGGVTDPIDSPDGFEVLWRTPVDEPVYALELVKLAFRAGVPAEDPNSRESALRLAHTLLQSVATNPPAFEALQGQYCCQGVEWWSRGRVAGTLVDYAAKLSLEGISREPVESPPFLLLAKRVDPRLRAPPRFDLPAPRTVDIERIAGTSSGTAVAASRSGPRGQGLRLLGPRRRGPTASRRAARPARARVRSQRVSIGARAGPGTVQASDARHADA